jgi:hypothetical protein
VTYSAINNTFYCNGGIVWQSNWGGYLCTNFGYLSDALNVYNVPTKADITAAVAPYALSSSLSGLASNSSLSAYATTASLQNYVTQTQFSALQASVLALQSSSNNDFVFDSSVAVQVFGWSFGVVLGLWLIALCASNVIRPLLRR